MQISNPSRRRLLSVLLVLLQHLASASSSFRPLVEKLSPQALSISLSADRVTLGDTVTVRCHVNPTSEAGLLMTKTSMILYCPLADERTFCFQNCAAQDNCHPESRDCRNLSDLGRVRCHSIKRASGEVVYEYTVERVTPDWLDWRSKGFACASGSEKTPWKKLEQIAEAAPPVPSRPQTTMTSTTMTSTTTTSTTTSTAAPHPITPVWEKNITQTTAEESSGRGLFDFFGNASHKSGSFWTPEMVIIIALAALALSLFINCFCCGCWLITRRHRKASGDSRVNHKAGMVQPFEVYPLDPRFGGLPAQQMSPRTAYHMQMNMCGQSLSAVSASEETASWAAAGNIAAAVAASQSAQIGRSHPEGKAVLGGIGSASGGARSSDSGFSATASGCPPHTRYFSVVGQPRWGSPATQTSRNKAQRFSYVAPPPAYLHPGAVYGPYFEMPKRCSSRETVFSERALSEAEMGRYYIPVVVGSAGGVGETMSMRASRPHLAGFSASLWNPETSLVDGQGAGSVGICGGGVADGASTEDANNAETAASNSGGAGSGSPSFSSRKTPRNVYLTPFKAVAMAIPTIASTQEPKSKSKSPPLNNEVLMQPTPGQNSAEVRKWLQSMSQESVDKCELLPSNPLYRKTTEPLVESLNAEYDAHSDWGERDPMLHTKGTPSQVLPGICAAEGPPDPISR